MSVGFFFNCFFTFFSLPLVLTLTLKVNILSIRHISQNCLKNASVTLGVIEERCELAKGREVGHVQASYRGVTVPSFHSIKISPRCNAGEERGRRMACSVSGALSLGTGDPGMLPSGLGVYDFRTHTTFLLLVHRDKKKENFSSVFASNSMMSLKQICSCFSLQWFVNLPRSKKKKNPPYPKKNVSVVKCSKHIRITLSVSCYIKKNKIKNFIYKGIICCVPCIWLLPVGVNVEDENDGPQNQSQGAEN